MRSSAAVPFAGRLAGTMLLAAMLAGCESTVPPVAQVLTPLPAVGSNAGAASPRVNGRVGPVDTLPPAQTSTATPATIRVAGPPAPAAGGDISLDFTDTDVREVVAQILGNTLRVNYAIDPAVHGSVTFRTAVPLSRAQLLPTLEALLSQDGAALLQSGGIYRVVPAAAAAGPGLSTGAGTAGAVVVPLRYASAEDLAKILQPYAQNGAKVIANAGGNTLLISGDASARDALVSLSEAFDVDILAGQSYALFPVDSGDATAFAQALQTAFRSGENQALAGVVRVVPMARISSVLVVAPQPRFIDGARRVYDLVSRARRESVRAWHVYYLQNSNSSDVAYVLQQAFTPNNVTAQPSGATSGGGLSRYGQGGGQGGGLGGGFGGQGGGGGFGGGSGGGLGGAGLGNGGTGGGLGGGSLGGGGGLTSGGSLGGSSLGGPTSGGAGAAPPGQTAGRSSTIQSAASNPLLGGLDASAGGADDTNTMRIIPNDQNNAILFYGTTSEAQTVEAVLRKIDILPLQVRIDAIIAEVTLNDNLQYGTQWFFKAGGVNGVLSFANQTINNPVASTLNNSFPGFFIGGRDQGGAPFAISALQAVTKVQVLSSPELLVLDNQPARLQVGDVVPYLSQTSQSTITSNAPVVSSINYQQTGVIMQVTPRVNSGGLVTLDISQDVSEVAPTVTTQGINSPTFQERSITSRVVVQDGQTIGLAGLIRDSTSRGNQGIPWLKDVPLLGLLAGEQTNTRSRTELLVLITPHVLHDQRDARALTEDLRDQLINAATVPGQLQSLRPSGSPDPGQRLRKDLRLEP